MELHNVETPRGESKREIVKHPGAVVILPVDSDNNVYLARQYRKPIERETIELPAGKLEANESAEVCAKRELSEELNLKASNWYLLASIYTSPGFTDEKMFIYVAEELGKCYGQGEEDEFIELEKMELEKLWEKIKSGQIEDGKTVLAVSMYKNIKNNL